MTKNQRRRAPQGMAQPLFPDDTVHLHVGGVHFTTSVITLTSMPESNFKINFAQMIENAKAENMRTKAQLSVRGMFGPIQFSFDRDPDIFRVILNCLRRRQPLKKPDAVPKEDWDIELKLWGFDSAPSAAGVSSNPNSLKDTSTTPAPVPPRSLPEVSLHQLMRPESRLYDVPYEGREAKLEPQSALTHIWDLLKIVASEARHGKWDTTHTQWTTSVSYRALRRAFWFEISGSRFLERDRFIRGVDIDHLEPMPEDVFLTVMKGVMKAFADQRINADLRYQISACGSGDSEVLTIRFERPKN